MFFLVCSPAVTRLHTAQTGVAHYRRIWLLVLSSRSWPIQPNELAFSCQSTHRACQHIMWHPKWMKKEEMP